MESESNENQKREGAMFTDLALTVFRKKHGRSEQNQKVKALTPHVPALVMFADHTKKMPWSCTYHSVLMFADISGFTSLCERYSAKEKSGIDELTSTLNGYMGAIVEGILSSDGDVLKYAGDAILAMWRVNIESELPATLDRVIQCCLDIQRRCGEWETDIGVTLTVKMGIAAGDMTMTFLGNSEFCHYVELGRVVSDVNRAESFCKSGYVVLSPHAWFLCNSTVYEHEKMDDGAHVRIKDVHATEVLFKSSSPEIANTRDRRFSLKAIGLSTRFMAAPKRRMSLETSTPSKQDLVIKESKETSSRLMTYGAGLEESARKSGFSAKTMSNVFKLRNVVKTVTAMRLEETLRLYILSPVLKKLDDNQPLEYLSEMRQVSIVFCNLVLEDAHDHTQLLQQIFDIVFSNIKLVHGCLNKIFLFDKGCTFLVIFGLPGFKHERDCAHALNISVKMKEILDNVSGIERVSVGVTTGTTFCGVVGHTRRHEYSVIGRKVNMAARLMMHYPGKVTCDDDTFQSCRLPPENFSVLVTKRMKGLQNIGLIREFSLPDEEEAESSELENNIPYSEYPLLGREEEKELFLRELNRLAGEETPRNHIIYVGAAGIGKTRLLDTLCNMTVKENMRLVSFSLVVHNTNTAHFLARHLLKVLLASCGYSQEIQKEPAVAETMRLCGMDQHIEVMGELLSSKVQPSGAISEERCAILAQVFEFLAKMCIDSLGPTVFIIDDMHFCDKESWDCILSLSEHAHVLLVLGLRSYALEQIQYHAAKSLFKENRSVVKDVYTLDLSLVSALACQCLDVVNIPKQLERLLVERSQGVPAWVERLLQEMFSQRQILIRYTDLSPNSFLGSVVAPLLYLITKTAIWRTKERKRPHVTPVFADIDTLQLSGDEDTMLTDLGFAMNKEPKDKNKSEHIRICVMAPGISVTDIPVPVSMKDLVVARIDSMRATEQLIVKCAAILEPPYTRQMLEEVLPQASTFKISESLKRLFENGTFECWNLSESKFGRLEDRRGECKCPGTEGVDGPEVLCNQLGFRHKLLQSTAQEMLMGKQKQRLHQKAGEFVEQRVKDLRKYVPYQLFVRNRDNQSNKKMNEYTSSDTPDEDAQASERFRTILKSGEMNPHLSLILERAVIDDKRTTRLEQMLAQYTKIAFHYSAADDMLCLLDIQTEAALVAIVLKKVSDALTWLSEAKVSLEKLERSTNQPAEVMANLRTIRAGLERLIGKAFHQGGQLVEAGVRFNEAANLLDLASLTSSHSRRFLMFQMKMSTFPKFIYFTRRGSVRQLRPATRKQIERGHLLGDMCRLHEDQGHLDLLLLDAWRYASNIIGKHVHIHQVLASYIHLISACRRRNWTKRANRLESELYATCCARSSELLYDDVKMLATSLGESALLSLNAGNIPQAVDRGQVAATLVRHMGHTRLSVKIYPILAFAYLAADRWEDCVELQEKLKQLDMDLEGWGVDAWSTVISLELMLAPGVPSQTFLLCLKRASSCLKNYDAAINGCIARYYIAMSIAVWYSRKGKWTEAQAWFDFWENYDVDMNNYLTVGAWCKKLECMLMSMCRTIETEAYDPYFKAKAEIGYELRKLKKTLKVVPGWKPRYHHLRAYYLLLQGKLGCTRNELQNCAQQCLKDKNAMELRLVQHTWRNWYSIITNNNSLNTDWLDQLETDLLDRRLQAQRAEQVLFAFPLPLQRPARRGRWWRSNKVRPQ